jgi:hypothetical protein
MMRGVVAARAAIATVLACGGTAAVRDADPDVRDALDASPDPDIVGSDEVIDADGPDPDAAGAEIAEAVDVAVDPGPPVPGDYNPLYDDAGKIEIGAIVMVIMNDAPNPRRMRVVGEAGACRHYSRAIPPECDPPCEDGEACDAEAVCVRFAEHVSAGSITIEGLGAQIVVKPDSYGYYTDQPSVPAAAMTPGTLLQEPSWVRRVQRRLVDWPGGPIDVTTTRKVVF